MNLINVTPRATEKAYAQSQNNVYVFNVPLAANKQQIVDAVESQFEVKVTGIKTLVQSGKAVRFSRGKNRYPGTTARKDSKKAYVTLAKGDSIQVFEQPESEEKK
ncbi:MAG TPA: 50S ribosomal protein L23 [Candidatus Saccharimonadales bacterium]|nr:50S ribosomal protein L23 [Candidatus Saccharimonadales bacterium]